MRDVHYPLRKVYTTALAGMIYNLNAVPAFAGGLPDTISVENYIIFGQITSNDISTKTSADTATLMRVAIHTHQLKYNTGNAADAIAGDVLNRIYATSGTVLDMSADNLQMISTDLQSDITPDWINLNSRVYLDRILIFRHKIYHI